jgi:hypothetical protein
MLERVSSNCFIVGVMLFPLYLSLSLVSASGGEVFVAHDDQLQKEERGSLLLPPKVRAGQTTVSITLEKIGLKDAQSYIGAYLSVSVATAAGQVLESQDTPKSNQLKPNYVIFGHTVHIQTTLEDIMQRSQANTSSFDRAEAPVCFGPQPCSASLPDAD